MPTIVKLLTEVLPGFRYDMHILYFLSSAYLLFSCFVFLYASISGFERLLSGLLFRKPGISMILFIIGASMAFATATNPYPPSMNFLGDILVCAASAFLSLFYFAFCFYIASDGSRTNAVVGFASGNSMEISFVLFVLAVIHIVKPGLAFF